MIDLVRVEDYQSIRKIRLELGRFTVITGATGSGKTAVMRALRLLAFNARGTSYVRRGQKSCLVLVFDDSRHQGVAIERGSRGMDSYAISDPAEQGNEQLFTKLAGKVPQEITSWLGLSELNFASQFDSPFLLNVSGSEVARTLGRLTNVTLLFDAAREANRRRMRIKDKLDDAQAEVIRLRTEIQKYAGLQARSSLIREAEASFARASVSESRAARLRTLLRAAETAETACREAPAPAAVPSLDRLNELLGRAARLRYLVDQCSTAYGQWRSATADAAAQEEDSLRADASLHELLSGAGACPLCGQPTKGMR